MLTLKSAENIKDPPAEPDLIPNDDAHWFFCSPRAGVTYYSFDAQPA